MAGTKRLNWGLLGTARINRAVIGPIQVSNRSRLAAVASRSIEKASAYAKDWGIRRYFATYDELLADPEIDIVYNSLPNSLHTDWSIKALQMGKHVLCEKPLAINAEDVHRIQYSAVQAGKVIAEAFMYRHHPQTLLVKQMLDRDEIGIIQIIRGSFCYTISRPDNPRLDPSLGGGSLWDVGCYPISYARYLTGEEPIRVYGNQVLGPTGVDMLFTGELCFPSGIISQFECSFISPSKSLIEITGEKGRITIPEPYKPGLKTKIFVEKTGRTRPLTIMGKELYQGEIEDIENAILNGKPTLISLEDSRANIATIEALYLSAQTSQSIQLHHLQVV
jgi:xylose dehydrogenase (NAD/NADP)